MSSRKFCVFDHIWVRNGREIVSRLVDLWAYANNVTMESSRPGKPTDNGFIESFNGPSRAECLNASWFLCLADTRSQCAACRTEYNEARSHSSIGQKTPVEWAKSSGQACLS